MASSSDNNKEECYPFQLIDGDGKFNGDELDDFADKVKLSESGASYVVASIVGPQSSGKSTLLNHLFGTDFKAMNAGEGKNQTTKGIWMANCPGINPHTLIMDIEGNDGQERGEVDTKFERQSALFALVVSNIVIVNMWYSDVGREQGANKPLLRVVFQAMVTMFKTNKVTLMFVIRDVDAETPFSLLEAQLKKAIQEIWEPIAPEKAPMSDFFNVQVVPLSHLKFQKVQFAEEVANLRKRFFNSISPGGLACDKKCLIPASGFSCSAKSLWETIKENNDLDIPSHKVLVSTVFCDKIVEEKFKWFSNNEAWLEVRKSAKDGHIEGFGVKINSLLDTCLVEYHERTKLYDDTVRETKQMVLTTRLLLQLIQPEWNSVVAYMGSRTLEMFKEELDEALQNGEDPSEAARVCIDSLNDRIDKGYADADIQLAKWDISIVKDKLLDDVINTCVTIIQVTQLKAEREARLAAAAAAEHEATKRLLEYERTLAANQTADREAAERKLLRKLAKIEAKYKQDANRREVEHERKMAAFKEDEARKAASVLVDQKKKYWIAERNYFFVYARDLSIAWSNDNRYWCWPNLTDISTSTTSEDSGNVAELIMVCWLSVDGTFEVEMLTPDVTYQISFVVMLKVPSEEWDFLVNFHLTLPDGTVKKHKKNLSEIPRGRWIEIPVGKFKTGASPELSGKIKFSMHEVLGGNWKTGLAIKGVAIQPMI